MQDTRYKHEGRQFGYKKYHVDTTGKNAQKIAGHIGKQLQEDAEQSLLTMDLDLFTGAKTLSYRPMPFRRSPVP